MKIEILERFSKNNQISSFMKIRPVGAESSIHTKQQQIRFLGIQILDIKTSVGNKLWWRGQVVPVLNSQERKTCGRGTVPRINLQRCKRRWLSDSRSSCFNPKNIIPTPISWKVQKTAQPVWVMWWRTYLSLRDSDVNSPSVQSVV
jgi:hypothetical protein